MSGREICVAFMAFAFYFFRRLFPPQAKDTFQSQIYTPSLPEPSQYIHIPHPIDASLPPSLPALPPPSTPLVILRILMPAFLAQTLIKHRRPLIRRTQLHRIKTHLGVPTLWARLVHLGVPTVPSFVVPILALPPSSSPRFGGRSQLLVPARGGFLGAGGDNFDLA